MKAYRIDPKERSITQFDYDGTVEQLSEHYPYNAMTAHLTVFNDTGDFLLCTDSKFSDVMIALGGIKFAKEYGSFAFVCQECDTIHHIFGVAILASRDLTVEDKVVFKNPSISLQELREQIGWGDAHEISKEELATMMEEHELPKRLQPDEPIYDARSEVTAAMELARITTKH
jgi:hypothetical protein